MAPLQDEVLPEGWKKFLDPTTGDAYYHNKSLQQTTWDSPARWKVGLLIDALREEPGTSRLQRLFGPNLDDAVSLRARLKTLRASSSSSEDGTETLRLEVERRRERLQELRTALDSAREEAGKKEEEEPGAREEEVASLRLQIAHMSKDSSVEDADLSSLLLLEPWAVVDRAVVVVTALEWEECCFTDDSGARHGSLDAVAVLPENWQWVGGWRCEPSWNKEAGHAAFRRWRRTRAIMRPPEENVVAQRVLDLLNHCASLGVLAEKQKDQLDATAVALATAQKAADTIPQLQTDLATASKHLVAATQHKDAQHKELAKRGLLNITTPKLPAAAPNNNKNPFLEIRIPGAHRNNSNPFEDDDDIKTPPELLLKEGDPPPPPEAPPAAPPPL